MIRKETMPSIMKPSAFDTNAIKLTNVIKNKQGSNSVIINYQSDGGDLIKKVTMQTPKMLAPFGLSEYPTEFGPKFSLDASFINKDEDPKIKQYYEMLNNIDEYMISTAVKNSKEWFGKNLSREIVEEFYRPLVKVGKQKKDSEDFYPSTVKYKIKTQGEHKNVEAYDVDRNPVNIDDIKKGSSFRALVEFSPIWFVNKNFGFSMNLIQIEISKPDKVTGFSFEDDSDIEFDDE